MAKSALRLCLLRESRNRTTDRAAFIQAVSRLSSGSKKEEEKTAEKKRKIA